MTPIPKEGREDSSLRIAAIKQRIAAVVEGPWVVADGYPNDDARRFVQQQYGNCYYIAGVSRCVVSPNGIGDNDDEIAEFIASSRSDLPYLVELVERLEQAVKYESDVASQALARVKELERENSALREDGERLDWLEKYLAPNEDQPYGATLSMHGVMATADKPEHVTVEVGPFDVRSEGVYHDAATLRDAIDAARSATPNPEPSSPETPSVEPVIAGAPEIRGRG